MSPTDERTGPRFPLLLTTGRILSQYNVGAQTRRTANVVWHEEDVLEIHPHDAEKRGIQRRRLGEARQPRRRDDACARRSPTGSRRASSTPPSTIPSTQANVVTTEYSDWATNCPEYKVTAVQVIAVQRPERLAGAVRRAHPPEPPRRRQRRGRGVASVAHLTFLSGCAARSS